jgi:hypothetical protein
MAQIAGAMQKSGLGGRKSVEFGRRVRAILTEGMGKLATLREAVAGQVASNRSAVGHEGHFLGHRAHLTREIDARAPEGGGGRLCLLGVGNANDVDLEALMTRYGEIHLVDIDREAVGRARARLTEAQRGRLVVHAPVDASGIFDRLEEWSRTPPPPAAIREEELAAVGRVVEALPGPFDVVVSCCMLTMLQLVLLEVVGDRNLRFEDLRAAVGRIHVRTLASLLAPSGVALLVTDLTANEMYPLDDLPPDADLRALMTQLITVGNVIHAAHPGLLSAEIRRDPELKAAYAVRFPIGPWIWHDGPAKAFLVYALEITAKRR